MWKICRHFKILCATAHRYCKLNLTACEKMEEKLFKVGGCPKKLSQCDERKLIRAWHFLRKNEDHFSCLWIMDRAGISPKEINVRTVQCCLNRHSYHFLQAWRKGLLEENDCKLHLHFAKMMRNNCSKEVWKKDFPFYLDSVNFKIKSCRPGTCTPDRRIWQKHCEGTSHGCTNKGRKEETGGSVIHLFVALSWMESILSILSMRISMECSLEHRKEIRNCVFKMEIPVKIVLQWKEYFNW